MRPRQLPSAAYLRECFSYNRRTGKLRWKKRPLRHFSDRRGHWVHNGRWAGKIAGHLRPKGWIVRLDETGWRAARLIWKMVTGKDPGKAVDHKNRDPSDNRWTNLRLARHGQNRANSPANRDRDLPKGVYLDRHRFRAILRFRGKNRSLGHYATPAEAHAAYVAEAKRRHGAFFRAA